MPTTITVKWPPNPVSEGVTKYQVFESKNGSLMAYKADVTPPLSELVIVNPLPGLYAWSVKAENFVGASALSLAASGPTIPSIPPTPVIVIVTG